MEPFLRNRYQLQAEAVSWWAWLERVICPAFGSNLLIPRPLLLSKVHPLSQKTNQTPPHTLAISRSRRLQLSQTSPSTLWRASPQLRYIKKVSTVQQLDSFYRNGMSIRNCKFFFPVLREEVGSWGWGLRGLSRVEGGPLRAVAAAHRKLKWLGFVQSGAGCRRVRSVSITVYLRSRRSSFREVS